MQLLLKQVAEIKEKHGCRANSLLAFGLIMRSKEHLETACGNLYEDGSYRVDHEFVLTIISMNNYPCA
jgi:hypothetical protein